MPVNLTPIQNRAIEVPDGVIVVTAGAGTGKTTVLAETVARKMVAENRVDIRDLLVLTFTRKAAAEMSERISSRLKKLANATDDQFEKGWLLENANNVPDAAIETIDAFAQRLLRDHPMDSGIDPAFGILSPERDRELGYHVANECLERWLENPPHEKWLEAVRAVAINDWPGALVSLHQFIITRKEPSWALFLLGKNDKSRDEVNEILSKYNLEILEKAEEIRRILLRDVGTLRELLEETTRQVSKKGEVPKYALLAREIIPDLVPLDAWLENPDQNWDDPIVRKVASWKLWGGNFKEGSTPGLARESCKNFKLHLGGDKDVQETLKSLCIELYLATFRPALTEAFLDFHHALVAARRSENVLSFADCEIEALKLLSANKSVRNRCSEKYKYMIVDEYQDINPLQQDLIFKLCRQSDESGLPANLYVVGDERQSIYGFRDADFTLLRDLNFRLKDVEDPKAGSRPLFENFRSRPELLNFVNHIFRYVWGRKDEQSDVNHTDLKASFGPYLEISDNAKLHPARIELDLVIADNAETGRRREACAIARRLAEIVRAGEIKIFDKGSGTEPSARPLKWGDCAVLIRRTAPFRLYEEEFSKLGIPYVTESGGGLWDTPEIADITALLYCLSSAPGNLDFAVLLRSPWVGLSDDALLKFAETSGGDSWDKVFSDICLTGEKDSRRFALFMKWFPGIRAFAGHVPVCTLIEQALQRSGYIDRIFALDRGRNARANIEKLISTFRDDAEIFDPLEAAEYLRWLRSENVTAAQAGVAPAGDQGAVTLATVHAAKGREWPLVVVADLGARSPRGRSDREILWDDRIGITFKKFQASGGDDGKSLSYYQAVDRASDRDKSEQKRVFYVAMTRAREFLILSSYISPKENTKGEKYWRYDKNSWLALINDAMSDDAESLLGLPDNIEPPRSTIEYMVGEPQEPDSDPAPLSKISRTFPLRVARNYFTATDVSAVVERDAEPPRFSVHDLEMKLSSLAVLKSPSAGRYMLTATEISTFDKCPRMYAYRTIWHVPQRAGFRIPTPAAISESEDEPSFDPENIQPENFEMPASSWGTLAHRLMEIIPLDADHAKILELAEDVFGRHCPDADHNVPKLASLATETLGLNIFKRLANCDIRREFRLLGKIAGTSEVVLGTIDLLADCEDKIIVIDYKSGKINNADTSDRAKSYSLQLALYAHLAASWKNITPENVEAYIVFLDPAKDVTVVLDKNTLSRAIATVNSLSEASAHNDFTATPSHDSCRYCDYRDICAKSMAP